MHVDQVYAHVGITKIIPTPIFATLLRLRAVIPFAVDSPLNEALVCYPHVRGISNTLLKVGPEGSSSRASDIAGTMLSHYDKNTF